MLRYAKLITLVVLASLAAGPARAAPAAELTAGELYEFCNSKDFPVTNACRFYILGAVQGLSLGAGSEMDSTGHFTTKTKSSFCIPDDLPQTQMVDIFQATMHRLARTYPQDLKSPAISLVAAALGRAFPCK